MSELTGTRVYNRFRQSCDSSEAYRLAHHGVIVRIIEGCNALVVVKFDGSEFESILPPSDLAFCDTKERVTI